MNMRSIEGFSANLKLFYMPHNDKFRLESEKNHKDKSVSQCLRLFKQQHNINTTIGLLILYFVAKHRRIDNPKIPR